MLIRSSLHIVATVLDVVDVKGSGCAALIASNNCDALVEGVKDGSVDSFESEVLQYCLRVPGEGPRANGTPCPTRMDRR